MTTYANAADEQATIRELIEGENALREWINVELLRAFEKSMRDPRPLPAGWEPIGYTTDDPDWSRMRAAPHFTLDARTVAIAQIVSAFDVPARMVVPAMPVYDTAAIVAAQDLEWKART